MDRKQKLRRQLPLHLMLLPGVVLVLIFSYIPLYGLVIAFQKFVPARGLFGKQEWYGWGNFNYIFSMPNSMNVILNTFTIALWKIIWGLVVPIVVSLLLNEVSNKRFKQVVQSVIYFPYFLSWIVFATIISDLLSPSQGIVNKWITSLGFDTVYFLGDNRYFQQTMVWTDVWKNFGYGTVVYMAAITGIDPTLYEAAAIDGAGRWKQTLHVTIPGMQMIIILMTVLSLGNVFNAGFDQIYNLYSPAVYKSGDIIDTLVYRLGLQSAKFGPAAAMGLFKSVISTTLIAVSYGIACKCFNYQLF